MINSPTPAPALSGLAPPQAPFGWDTVLPLRASDCGAMLAELYRRAIGGTPDPELAAGLCRELGRLLRLPLVLLARKLESGSVAVDAASRESSLWLELQRLPERWDSGMSSRGPAGVAFRTAEVAHQRLNDEGFALWHRAALGDQVAEVVAIPLGKDRLLELFCGTRIGEGARSGTLTIRQLAARLESFMDDVAAIRRQALLASALEGAGAGAFLTDLEGTILWSNRAFSALSGYAADEVRGRKASILRSGQQGLRYYRDLWATLRAGQVWSGETVDRAKDGSHYVIQQTVSPVTPGGRTTHYLSIHQDVGRQRRAQARLERAAQRDPATGLLTATAFGSAAARALADAQATSTPAIVVLACLRGLQRMAAMLDEECEAAVLEALGERIRQSSPGLSAVHGTFEYALLLTGADAAPSALAARLDRIAATLAEPLPGLGETPELDLHFGTARCPDEGGTLRELLLAADRRLANEPYRRARRIPDGELP